MDFLFYFLSLNYSLNIKLIMYPQCRFLSNLWTNELQIFLCAFLERCGCCTYVILCIWSFCTLKTALLCQNEPCEWFLRTDRYDVPWKLKRLEVKIEIVGCRWREVRNQDQTWSKSLLIQVVIWVKGKVCIGLKLTENELP